jgi:hypothetical protein
MTPTNFQVDSILRINVEFLIDTIFNQVENFCISQKNYQVIQDSEIKLHIIEYLKEYTNVIIYDFPRKSYLPKFSTVPYINMSNVPELWQEKTKPLFKFQLQLAFVCNLGLLQNGSCWKDALFTMSSIFSGVRSILEYSICIEDIINRYPNGSFILWEVFANDKVITLEDIGDIRVIQWESLFLNKGQFDTHLYNDLLKYKERMYENESTQYF